MKAEWLLIKFDVIAGIYPVSGLLFTTVLLKAAWTDSKLLLTSQSAVCSLDSPQDQTTPSQLNPATTHFQSGPVLSDRRGWTSELRPEKNS